MQRMPLAFFTRTQTGALVSRLNNDVTGAQEAFTDVLSNVIGNLISVAIVLAIMFVLSWQLTLVALVLLPLFMLPARWLGRRLQAITRELYGLNAEMNIGMVERFNVSGALLVKLFGHPDAESRAFREKAARVRDIDIVQAIYARFFFIALLLTAAVATALVYGWGGVLAVHGALDVGTVVALTAYLNRLYGPLTALSNVNVDLMTALVSFDRVFEVLDLPPMVAEKPDAASVPRGPARIEFDHVGFAYPTSSEVSLASLESVAVLNDAPSQQVLRDVSFTAEPGAAHRPRGPVGRRQDDREPARAAPVRRAFGRGAHRRHRRARRDLRLAARGDRHGHPGRPPLPRHDPRQPALRQARRRRRRAHRGAARRPDPAARSSRCPTGSRPSSATVATACRAARSNAWRSPGCCSRRPTSWCWTRPPPTSTPSPRSPCSGPSRRRLPDARRWSSPTGSRPCATPTRSSC